MNYYAGGGQTMAATTREMPASQIIMNDQFSQEDGSEQVIQSIMGHVEKGDGLLLQKNNTVLFLLLIAPKTVEVHLYTVDAPLPLASAVRYFHTELVRSGISKVYGTTPRTPQIVDLMKAVGIQILPSDNPEYSWMANV
jgi:hypothetical protein